MVDLYLGVLSGTSMDAIDITVVEFNYDQAKLVHALNINLPQNYKQQYLDIINRGTCDLNTLGELDEWTGEIFANAILEALQQFKLKPSQIKAIGSHGQTIWHVPNAPRPFTMQLGNPHIIQYKTGITTVADFRRSDMAAGGQGAPLAPLFHQAQFSDPKEPRCIVNIGGLSNITILDGENILGFDTGPGNCLLDTVAKKYFNQDYDDNGEIARSGTIDQELLTKLKQDPYFRVPIPKSTGREYFNEKWLGPINLEPKNLLATLLRLTAETICDAVCNYAPANTKVFLCGGGSHNLFLQETISTIMEQDVQTTQALGIDPNWVEGCLFAWLAKMAIEHKVIDTSKVTGSKKPKILGVLYR